MTANESGMDFYGHIRRMKLKRIANRILNFQVSRKTQISWVKEVHEDLEKSEIMAEDIGNRNVFGTKIVEVKVPFIDKTRRRRRMVYWKKIKIK